MTRENIIVAALRLFLMRGYKSVSLVDVANELSISKGAIYHYFTSKEELLRVSMHFFFDRLEANYKELLAGAGSLRTVLQALLVEDVLEIHAKELLGVDNTCGIDHIHFAIEIVRLFPDVQNKAQKNHAAFCAALTLKIQQAVKTGEIREDVDSEALSASIVALLNGQKSLGFEFQTSQMRQRMLNIVWNMIAKLGASRRCIDPTHTDCLVC
ncbi:TetR/AcrR family transcriptional regulator [Sporomusa aerivorans]|uniref:TetR/AcrR family transcriptional regulator n=1 Tax=Sporomusa aerivorans TaxID=204936 RepID=UPI00352AC6D3